MNYPDNLTRRDYEHIEGVPEAFNAAATDHACEFCGKERMHPFDMHIHTREQAIEQLDLIEMDVEDIDHASAYAVRVRASNLKDYLREQSS